MTQCSEYVFGEVLHEGSSTRVVRGTHRLRGEQVVMKILIEESPAPTLVDRLRHEHALLQELTIKGVIRALDLAPHGAGVMLVLESWGDTSLDRVLKQRPLAIATVLHLGAALARVLGELHRCGLIHRDIKPQNVLVDAERTEVKLCDLGIATRRRGRSQLSGDAESLGGTLAYMAPEQTGRMNRAVDGRADLYALGVTLYEMLTGTLPFESTDALELIHAHIARAPEPPHERARERAIPPAISAIVQKLLAKNPDDRYQTADGVAFDLERAARAWGESGTVGPFDLGARDWDDRIRSPSRLFGRELESAALLARFDEACGGAAVLMLVAGPSGVGK